MKQVLEAIWRDSRCRCPSNAVWWNHTSGHKEEEKLFWRKGRRYYYTQTRKKVSHVANVE